MKKGIKVEEIKKLGRKEEIRKKRRSKEKRKKLGRKEEVRKEGMKNERRRRRSQKKRKDNCQASMHANRGKKRKIGRTTLKAIIGLA